MRRLMGLVLSWFLHRLMNHLARMLLCCHLVSTSFHWNLYWIDPAAATRTLDLASALEVGHGGARSAGEADMSSQNLRSVLTIAFQFTFENHYRDSVAAMARQYVRSIVASVQRIAMAIAPSKLSSQMVPKPLPGSPGAVTLAQWICRSYSVHSGGDLLQAESQQATLF